MQFGFGAGVLYGTRNDVANGAPVRFGALQDVSIEFDGEIKELYGQSQYALDVARGKTKIMGKAKYAQISGLIMANMFFGSNASTGQTLSVYNEEGTSSAVITGTTNATTAAGNATLNFASTPAAVAVGASVADATAPAVIPAGTYVLSKTGTTVVMSANATGAGVGSGDTINFGPSLTVANAATFAGDLGVFYASDGSPLTYVSGAAPAQGEYTVTSGGVYSFNSADANTAMLFNYLYTNASVGFTLAPGNPLMGTTPKFQAVFTQTYGSTQLTVKLHSCVSQKFSIPTKLDDYIIQEFDFQAFANSAGSTVTIYSSS